MINNNMRCTRKQIVWLLVHLFCLGEKMARKNMKIPDLVGTVYKGFEILDYKRENGRSLILVKCPLCGKEAWKHKDKIDRGMRSCGCYSEKFHEERRIDLSGKKVGRLTVLEPTEKRYNGCVVWKCKCDCGNTKEVPADELKNGLVKSCGCLRDEKRKLNGKKVSKISEKYLIDGTSVLRLAGKVPSNNTSGTKGVYYNKRSKKWIAQIVFKGHSYFLGGHEKKEDAIKARKTAEKEKFGNFLEWYKNKDNKKDQEKGSQ